MKEEKKTTKTMKKNNSGSNTTKKKSTVSVEKKSSSKSNGNKTGKSTPSKKTNPTAKKKSTTSSNQVKKTTNKKVSTKKATPKKESTKKSASIEEKKYVITETLPQEVEEIKNEEVLTEEIKPEEKIVIPFTNYVIAVIAVIWVFIILFLGFHLYQNHQEVLYDEGYFNQNNDNVKKFNFNEIRQEIVNSEEENIFVLFNVRGEKENYVLEKELDQIISDYHLEKNFYYVDITDMNGSANCGVDCLINQEFSTNQIESLPAIVYLKDKKVTDVAQREDQKTLESADFVKILDMYEFKK